MSSEKDGKQANEGKQLYSFSRSFISILIVLYCLISRDFDRKTRRWRGILMIDRLQDVLPYLEQLPPEAQEELVMTGQAAPLLPRATTRVPKVPGVPASATPALTMTTKPLRRPRRSHSKGGGGCGCGEGTLEVALAGDALM